MIVVSDTSPILNLAVIGSLELLRTLYGTVIIPPAVHDELSSLAQRQARFAGSSPAELPLFLKVRRATASANSLADQFRWRLHSGEAEALALAIDCQANLFLVDERAARIIAGRHALRTIGLLGVLVAAKRHNLIPLILPLLERLSLEANFYMSARLRADVLSAAGETIT